MKEAMVHANVYVICRVVHVSVEYEMRDLIVCNGANQSGVDTENSKETYSKLPHNLSVQVSIDVR